jgi:uncharacterized surface protein with fasciclin (FAS1) repeats
VRKIRRLAAVGAAAVVTAALAACGTSASPPAAAASSEPAAASPAPATSAAASASNGVTTKADVFGPACGTLPQGTAPGSLDAMGPQPVATAASANPLLTTLATAVKAVPGLPDTLDSTRGITVFAPTNSAFDAVQKQLGATAFQGLLKNPTVLGSLLSYHVIGQRYDAAGLVAAGTTTELAGGTVTIGGTAAAPTITDGQGNTAKVLCGNIPTSNATVFVIDRVLLPKS